MSLLSLLDVSKSFGGHPAVEAVSFVVEAGQVLALLGPSGSGKSTLLSLVAGLEAPDRGDILWEGRSMLGAPPHERGFGLMFQDYALFPHLDVAHNVGFGLRMQRRPPAEVQAGVQRALELVGLPGFERRDVSTLSGGEQQRVALARALAPGPRLLMLDEPLGALDRALRERLLEELRGILHRLRLTAVYVTHDQEEAFALADEVVVMRAGRVAHAGPPAEVYARPASRFVAEFLGEKNVLRARLIRRDGRLWAQTAAGDLPIRDGAGQAGEQLEILLRADGTRLAAPGRGQLAGVVLETSFRGRRAALRLQAGTVELVFEVPAGQAFPAAGERIELELDPLAVYPLPATDQ